MKKEVTLGAIAVTLVAGTSAVSFAKQKDNPNNRGATDLNATCDVDGDIFTMSFSEDPSAEKYSAEFDCEISYSDASGSMMYDDKDVDVAYSSSDCGSADFCGSVDMFEELSADFSESHVTYTAECTAEVKKLKKGGRQNWNQSISSCESSISWSVSP